MEQKNNLVGVISDTHENEEAIKKAVRIFMKRSVGFMDIEKNTSVSIKKN